MQKNEVMGTDPVDQRVVHHHAEGQDEKHTHAQEAGAEEAEAPQKIFSFFSSFDAKTVHVKHLILTGSYLVKLYTSASPFASEEGET